MIRTDQRPPVRGPDLLRLIAYMVGEDQPLTRLQARPETADAVTRSRELLDQVIARWEDHAGSLKD